MKNTDATPTRLTYVGAGAVLGLASDADNQAYFVGQNSTAASSATMGRLDVSGNVQVSATVHTATYIDALNAVAVTPSRLAFMVGTSSSPAANGYTTTAATGTVTTAGAQIGWRNTNSGNLSGTGSANNGNDVLTIGAQYNDILLVTNPPTTPPVLKFSAQAGGSPSSNVQTVTISTTGSGCSVSALQSSSNTFVVTQQTATVYSVAIASNAQANVGSTVANLVATSSGCDNNLANTTQVGTNALQFNVGSTLNIVPQGTTLNSLSISSSSPTSFSGSTNGANGVITVPLTVSTNGGSVSFNAALSGVTGPTGNSTPNLSSCFALPNGNNIQNLPTGTAIQVTAGPTVINLLVQNSCLQNNSPLSTPGTYTGNIVFTPTVSTVANVTLPFTITVGGSTTLGGLPSALNFAFASGTTAPTQQSVTITPSGVASSVTYTATITNAASLNTGSSQAPAGLLSITSGATGTVSNGSSAVIVVQANPTGATAGTYQATLSISYAGQTQTVPINVVVGNGIVVSPTSVTLSAPKVMPVM
jgi:hypothetical protein